MVGRQNPIVGFGTPIDGVVIVESEWMTVSETVGRSWKERLCSWPWRPWRKTKVVQAPSDKVYRMNTNTLVCHPVVAEQIRNHVQEISYGRSSQVP